MVRVLVVAAALQVLVCSGYPAPFKLGFSDLAGRPELQLHWEGDGYLASRYLCSKVLGVRVNLLYPLPSLILVRVASTPN